MSHVPESHLDLLTKPIFWHIATIGPDGKPQTSPVWGGWDGEHFLFSLTKTRQKFLNLEANPAVAVSALDAENGYRYLELRGTIRVEDDTDVAFIDSMAKKYLDMDEYPNHQEGDERVIMILDITHTTHKG